MNAANQVKRTSIPQLGTITQKTKFFPGYQFGAFYKAKLQEQFWVAAEVSFSVIGSGMTLITEDGNSYDAHEKLGYIELPLMVQYRVGKFYFGAGHGLSLKLFAKITNFENRSFNLREYRRIDAAINVLSGYCLSKKLDVNIRYSHGIRNLYKDPGYAVIRNRFLNFSLLYGLNKAGGYNNSFR